MAKLLLLFPGTGDSAHSYAGGVPQHDINNDVITIIFSGCQDPNVGNGVLLPNLDIVANNIKKAFNENGTLNLDRLRKKLGTGIGVITPDRYDEELQVTSIGLEGFSRGAVTTFAVAKKLDFLNIPMDIIANQPVPGPGIFSRYNDLTHCKNIRSALTLIASYHLENGVVQNNAFQQMVTQFPTTTQWRNVLIPYQGHFGWYYHSVVPYNTY